MEKRAWLVRSSTERGALLQALEDDGFRAEPQERAVGAFVIVDAAADDWDIVEALVATIAPSASEAKIGR